MLFSQPLKCQNLADYIELKAEKFKEEEDEYVGVYPTIKTKNNDVIGKFIADNPRRFNYLLTNHSNFIGYEKYFPDTEKINRLYINDLRSNQKFVAYFKTLISPVISKEIVKDKYSINEVMKVASVFFFCDSVRPDQKIQTKICIALNGIKEAKFEKDYTIIEAFSFEAIFEAIEKTAPQRTKFVENFLKYVDEISEIEKSKLTTSESYLNQVRLTVFNKMANDPELKKILLERYQKNSDNLSFVIY